MRKEYLKDYNRRYRIANRDHIVELKRMYYKKHHEDILKKRASQRGGNVLKDAKNTGAYLGCHVAERALSRFFDNIIRMPMNNPGYDFLCGKGFKIDVKSACLSDNHGEKVIWHFNIRKNTLADYFLFLGFDKRDTLKPQRVWLMPGKRINHQNVVAITNTTRGLSRFADFEKPLDKVVACCSEMRIEDLREVKII